MFENDNKLNENNLVYDYMTKAIKYNLEYLNRLAKSVTGNNKAKA